jgi:hypothetical protein
MTDLLCTAHIDLRSTKKRVESAQRLHRKLDNPWARQHIEGQALYHLALAAYPGTPGLEATYHNARHELLRGLGLREILADVVNVLELSSEWHGLEGKRKAITDTTPTIWRPAQELDL